MMEFSLLKFLKKSVAKLPAIDFLLSLASETRKLLENSLQLSYNDIWERIFLMTQQIFAKMWTIFIDAVQLFDNDLDWVELNDIVEKLKFFIADVLSDLKFNF